MKNLTAQTGRAIPRNRRNDKYNVSPAELLLIRAGQHLWQARKKALKSQTVDEYRALDAALETVWEAKRLVRAELKAEREKAAEQVRAYFAERKAA